MLVTTALSRERPLFTFDDIPRSGRAAKAADITVTLYLIPDLHFFLGGIATVSQPLQLGASPRQASSRPVRCDGETRFRGPDSMNMRGP